MSYYSDPSVKGKEQWVKKPRSETFDIHCLDNIPLLEGDEEDFEDISQGQRQDIRNYGFVLVGPPLAPVRKTEIRTAADFQQALLELKTQLDEKSEMEMVPTVKLDMKSKRKRSGGKDGVTVQHVKKKLQSKIPIPTSSSTAKSDPISEPKRADEMEVKSGKPGPETPLTCYHCDTKFTTKRRLRDHISNVLMITPRCRFCNHMLFTKEDKEKHERKHKLEFERMKTARWDDFDALSKVELKMLAKSKSHPKKIASASESHPKKKVGSEKAGSVLGPKRVGSEIGPTKKVGSEIGPKKVGSEIGPKKVGLEIGPKKVGSEIGSKKVGSEIGPKKKVGSEKVGTGLGSKKVVYELGPAEGISEIKIEAQEVESEIGTEEGVSEIGPAKVISEIKIERKEVGSGILLKKVGSEIGPKKVGSEIGPKKVGSKIGPKKVRFAIEPVSSDVKVNETGSEIPPKKRTRSQAIEPQTNPNPKKKAKTDTKPKAKEPGTKQNKNSVSKSKKKRTDQTMKVGSCQICHDWTGPRYLLLDHIDEHIGKKKFKCTICSKAFVHESKLKIHVETHSRGKPFKSNLCESRFATVAGLKRHYVTHIKTGMADLLSGVEIPIKSTEVIELD